jgi:uncharacterized protein with von Willebrand factor type A (vWA) domain
MENITRSIIDFCRLLRENGFPVGIKETLDSLSALNIVKVTDRAAFKSALRSILSTSKEEFEIFDSLFEQYWQNLTLPFEGSSLLPENLIPTIKTPEGRFHQPISDTNMEVDSEVQATSGASAVERLKQTDFSQVPVTDLPMLEQIAFQLWKKMSVRMMRRWRSFGKNGPIDLRRTIRDSISHGGEPMNLLRKGRKKQKMRLVVLLDVSGSMDLYSTFLLRFVYVLSKYFKRVDSFLFSTRLISVSRSLRKDDLSAVFRELSENVQEWSGGTRIGESLQDFNLRFSQKLLTKKTVVIVLSDGWDTGAPELLSDQLAAIKRRIRKLIWLNPLLGISGYEPITRGMMVAQPYADVFAPAHNLKSLLDLEQHWNF